MSSPVQTVFADDFMHLALGRISRLDIRSWRDQPRRRHARLDFNAELIRQRVSNALLIGDQLASAETLKKWEALAALPMMSVSLLDDGGAGHDIAA